MTSSTTRAIQLLGLLGLSGCAAASGPVATAEDVETEPAEQAVLDRIDALGLDSSSAVIEGNLIGVEGDILLHMDKLLAGEYDRVEEPSADGLVDKGYRSSGIVNSTNDGNIKLMATAEVFQNQGIINGAVVAGNSWSLNSTIDIKGSNTGPGITIKMVDTLPCPGAGSSVPACAEFPSSGKPGHSIYLKRAFPGGCGWTGPLATYVLGHEMGHTIGMMHPSSVGNHIPNTGSCDLWFFVPGGAPEICDAFGLAPYDTVMNSYAWGISNCSVADPYLGEDDLLSVSELY